MCILRNKLNKATHSTKKAEYSFPVVKILTCRRYAKKHQKKSQRWQLRQKRSNLFPCCKLLPQRWQERKLNCRFATVWYKQMTLSCHFLFKIHSQRRQKKQNCPPLL
jgi:hypothetical protein